MNGQVHYADAPSTSFSNGDKFCKAERYQQTDSVAPPQSSPAKEALCGTSAYSTSSGCPFCSGHNGISVGGDSSGLGFYSLMSLGLTLVIMTVEFEFLEEEGHVLLIIVSLRGIDLEVGVLWYGVALWAEGKNLIVVQGNLNAQGYITRILQPEAVPFLQRHGPAILTHDNARPHVARICRQFLNRNNVNVLPWPAVSPDVNPIEHIWDYLGRKVRARGNVHNLRDLENALIQEWNNIPSVVIRRYIRSMRGRLAACINSRGGHTRY